MIYVEVQMRDIYNSRDERSGRTSPPGRAASVAGASVMKLLPSVGDHSRLVRQPSFTTVPHTLHSFARAIPSIDSSA